MSFCFVLLLIHARFLLTMMDSCGERDVNATAPTTTEPRDLFVDSAEDAHVEKAF